MNPIQEEEPGPKDESGVRRHMTFPGFEVDPGHIEGARFSRVRETPGTKSGYERVRWWVWPGEDAMFDSWLEYGSALLLVALGLMISDIVGVFGGRCALAIVWGPMFGVFAIVTVVRLVLRRRGTKP